MVHIAEPVTLDKLLPLIQKLSERERELLRAYLIKDAVSDGPPGCTTRRIRTRSRPKSEGNLRQSSQK